MSGKNWVLKSCLLVVFLSALVLFVLAGSTDAKGKTITVDDDGNGDFTTIQDAVNASADGDEIEVWEGVYRENVVVNRTLSLIGNGSEKTTIDGQGTGDVVTITADWCNVSGFKVKGGGKGAYDAGIKTDTNHHRIFENNCSNNVYGIYFTGSNNCTIENNICSSNNDHGIYFTGSNNCTIMNNNCSNNGRGIGLTRTYDCTITSNTVNNNSDGISLSRSDHCTATNNTCTANSNGIYLSDYSHNYTIMNNTCSNNNYGIRLKESNDGTIMNNNCSSNNNYGIYLRDTSNCTIKNNNCPLNNNGIYLARSSVCTIKNNTCSSNNNYAIYLRDTSNCTIKNNTMYECGINLYAFNLGNGLEYWNSHTVETSNTVNGKPVYYYKNLADFTVPSGAGQVILANCTRIRVEDQNCSNGSTGILLGSCSGIVMVNNSCSSNIYYGINLQDSSNCTIKNNSCENNVEGIKLQDSSNCRIEHNSCDNNDKGIILQDSSSCTIEHNSCDNNTEGINLQDSSYCVVQNNTCKNNTKGIRFYDSNVCILTSNTFSWNNKGVYLSRSDNNTLTKNTISENSVGIYLQQSAKDNTAHSGNIYNNSEYGINATENSGFVINATNNWWGDDFGPYHPKSNTKGKGDNITDYVLFDPWTGKRGKTTLYVDDDAPDGGNGSKEKPYKKVQDAVNASQDGDTIRVWEGVYRENVVVNRTLTIIGNGSETTIINASGNGDALRITADWCNVSGFSMSWANGDNQAGIYVSAGNTTISNTICENNYNGIFLDPANGTTLTNNICSYNSWYGIRGNDSAYLTVSGNTCTNNSYVGIYLRSYWGYGNDNTLTDNICNNNLWNGITIDNNDKLTGTLVKNNTCRNNAGSGIQLRNRNFRDQIAIDNSLEDNTCLFNKRCGIDITISAPLSSMFKDHTLEGNNCSYNEQDGITIMFSGPDASNVKNNMVQNNSCWENARDGLRIRGNDGFAIENNSCQNNSENGIYLYQSDGNTLTGNIISSNARGIYLTDSSRDNRAHYNFIYSNAGESINATDNDGHTINATKNYWGDATGPHHGVNNTKGQGDNVTDYVDFGPWYATPTTTPGREFVQVIYNPTRAFSDTILGGVAAAHAGDTVLVAAGTYYEQVVVDEDIALTGSGSATTIMDGGSSGSVMTITADGAIISMLTVTGSGGDPGDSGIRVESSGTTITSIISRNNDGHGIYLAPDAGATIADNNCSHNNGDGIHLDESTFASVEENICSHNDGHGIYVGDEAYASATDNICSHNGWNGIVFGYEAGSASGNTCTYNGASGIAGGEYGASPFRGNNCSYNDYAGISLGEDCRDFTLDYNICLGNGYAGIALSGDAGSNTIRNNILADNDHAGLAFGDAAGSSTAESNDITGNEVGIHLDGSGGNIISDNVIRENGEGMRVVEHSMGNIAYDNDISGNDEYGINAKDARYSISASDNWWGHATGPYHATNNTGGKGNEVTDNVEFGDWNLEPPSFVEYELPQAFIDVVTPTSIREGEEVVFSGHGTAYGSMEAYAWVSSLDDEIFRGASSDFATTNLSNGTHTIYFKVMDNYGVWSEADTATVDVNGIPWTTITSISPSPAITTDTIHFVGSVVDDASVGTYVWRTDEDELYNGTESDFYHLGLVPGTYTIYFRAQDGDGVWGKEVSETLVMREQPTAVIQKLTPTVALAGKTISFRGAGIGGGNVVRYVWSSSLTGEIYNGTEAEFTTSLGIGTHSITLAVVDNYGVWSEEVGALLMVHMRPQAAIFSINPPTVVDGEEVWFSASVSDDGSIVRYVWRSSIDGEFYNGTESLMSYKELSPGDHTIYLKVQDDNLVWSREVSSTLTIYAIPTVEIEGLLAAVVKEGKAVEFKTNITADGDILLYVWHSSRDGEIYNGSEAEFKTSRLSPGNHTITLLVKDTHGSWSEPVQTNVVVEEKDEGSSTLVWVLAGLLLMGLSAMVVFFISKRNLNKTEEEKKE